MSNFFRVSDEKEFERFVKKWDLTPLRRDGDRFGFKRVGKESPGIPRAHQGADGRPIVGDILRDLAAVLSADDVAIVMENVVYPARAVVRLNAVAVKKGEDPIRLSLNQIYDLVLEKWGAVPTKIDWAV
jgi:hypothetical protein